MLTLNMLELPYKDDFLLEIQNNNYSQETVYNYRRDLTVFEAFMNIHKVDFSSLTKRSLTYYKGFLQAPNYLTQIIEFWNANKNNLEDFDRTRLEGIYNSFSKATSKLESDQSLSGKSVNRMLSALRSYFKYLVEFELIEKMPITSDSIKLIKTEKKTKQVAELKELIKLMEFPSEYEIRPLIAARNRAIMEMLFSSGMRISELIKLNRDQINAEGKVYVQGKGKKQRFIYITPRARFFVNEYLKLRRDTNNCLFAPTRGGRNNQKGKRISANYVQERIAHYRRLLGIIVPTSAHSFRHGFATYLAEEGASPAAIQILLGHESLHTTDRYVHASDKFAQDTHKRFHPLYTK